MLNFFWFRCAGSICEVPEEWTEMSRNGESPHLCVIDSEVPVRFLQSMLELWRTYVSKCWVIVGGGWSAVSTYPLNSPLSHADRSACCTGGPLFLFSCIAKRRASLSLLEPMVVVETMRPLCAHSHYGSCTQCLVYSSGEVSLPTRVPPHPKAVRAPLHKMPHKDHE